MKEFIFIIKEEKVKEIKEIFEIKFDLFQCQILIKSLSQFIKLSLRDIELKQHISNNKEDKNILFSKNKNENNINNIINNCEENLLLIEFENNYLLPISPFKFKLHFGRQMYIILDYYYIYYLYNLFLIHVTSIDLNNLTSMVNEKIFNIVQNGYINLIEDKEKKEEENDNNNKFFNINIDILLNAPIILLPLNFRDENNTELMYVSLGQLKIKSELAGEKDKNAIYDKYIVEFSNITIKTLKNYNSQVNLDEEGEKLIYPSFSFNIDAENYIYKKPKLEHKKIENFSPFLINIIINSTKFRLSENQISFMIIYIENFLRAKFLFEKVKEKKEQKKNKKNKEAQEIIKTENNENKKEIGNNIDDKKEIDNKPVDKPKENKKKEINNLVKISIKLGVFKISLIRNLINDEKIENNKKITFLSFYFRESAINFLMKSNGSIEMDMLFGHFYLYDKDYKLDNNQNKIPYINPEFKCIIGTTSFGIKDKKTNKIKFSEIYDFKDESNIKESVKILFTLDTEQKMTTVNIFMSKLTISPNFSTLSRLYLFLNKYLELYNDSMNKLKYEKYRENIEDENIIKIDKNKENDSFAPPPINIQENDSFAPPPINIIEKESKIIKVKEYSLVNVLFAMKGIDIYLPVEPSSHNTFIIFMSIETPLKYSMETDVELELSYSKLLKANYNIKSNQLLIEINKGNFSIYDYEDDAILLNSINQIYDDIDFSFLMRNKINKEQKCKHFHIIAQMNKGMDISININEIIVFLDLFDKINSFLKELNDLNIDVEKTKKKKEIKYIQIFDEDRLKRARTQEIIDKK